MGQINYNTWNSSNNANSRFSSNRESNKNSWINYFTLKNDKDSAVVRFMHDSPDDFDMVAAHRVAVDGKSRWINCIRDPHEDLAKCPLCNSGSKLENRLFVHLIEYVRNEDGTITPTPRIWEKSASYANTLANLINEYGPLSDCIFKITRNGAKGSTSTTYDIMYGNPNVYKDEIYPKDVSLFEGYQAVGRVVWDYKYDKLVELSSGVATKANEEAQVTPRTNSYTPSPAKEVPNYSVPTNTERSAPGVQSPVNEGVDRPTRRYY